jgi:hypothetical protein
MLNEAKSCGLPLDLSRVPGWKEQSAEGEIRNSFTEFWNTMPDVGKWFEKFNWDKVNRQIKSEQKIHASVLNALAKGYKPDALPPVDKAIELLNVEPWFE